MPCSATRLAVLEWHPHGPTTPSAYHAGTTGVRSEPHPLGITQCITGRDRNHAHRESRCPERACRTTGLRTTRCTTSNPHNELPYHTGTTSAGTTERAERAFHKRDSPHHIEKGMVTTLPRVPNGLPFSCRERAATSVSKCKRSRARSGQLQCRVRRAGLHPPSASGMCRPHRHRTTPAQRALIGTTRIWDHTRHNGP